MRNTRQHCSAFRQSKLKRNLVLLPLGLLLGCQSGLVNEGAGLKATEGYTPEQTDKLFVVDCLLPGQIRKLGSQMTYLSPRRAVKTTAGDCEIRGGEYVAYDRANYATALRVWLPQAQQGDAEAQATVGEIYEKGLGGMADPALAAQWYRKAAEQGNSRAQINLGHLYEKGLGVKKDLREALNWYRKASGLVNTDLQFASVTEAEVASGFEKQLEELRKTSESYQQEAESLRKQLTRAQRNFAAERRKLTDLKDKLEQTREQLQQEKEKTDGNEELIQKLEKDLQRNESSYNAQQVAVEEMAATMDQKSRDQVIASESRQQLESHKQELKDKEAQYHDAFIRIKRELKLIEERSSNAKTTQDKLAVEQLRGKLKSEKDALLAMGRQIKQLKDYIAENEKVVASLENNGNGAMNLAQAGIEIIEPQMVLTRGVPSYQLRSIAPTKKIIGKVAAFDRLDSLTVNGRGVNVDKRGVFETLVSIDADLNPVKIVANYKKGSPSVMNFNLLAKTGASASVDQYPPANAVAKTYPSVDFGRFYALVIGNKDYKQLPSLSTSVEDAKAVDEILRNRYGYKTTLLINADRYQIMTAFNDLRKILTEKDNLLIYYAGHGEIDKTDNSAYWLPTDAESNNAANWLSSHSITEFLNIIAAKHILVVADSCYSGAMTQTAIARLPEQMAEEKRKKWLQFMVRRKARTVMTSGGVKPVLDTGGGRHSIFAKAFLQALQNNSGLMEDYELFRSVSGRVQQSAASVGFQQAPQYSAMLHAGHEGSPFFFVPKVN